MIRALVFDFDGLILETELPVYQSWLELFQKYGLDLPFEIWALNIGTSEAYFDPVNELEKRFGQDGNLAVEVIHRRERELELIGDQPPMPGVKRYLEDARRLGLKIGLASSSSCEWVEGHLERLGLLPYFDVIRAKDDVAITKPDPALYRKTVQMLGVLPNQAIAFEDSPNGILSARRAGLFCVAIPNSLTSQTDTSQADLVLSSLEELSLEQLLEKIEGIAGRPIKP
jgi:HAD superfamily hydrolase (TIGR01509 family)